MSYKPDPANDPNDASAVIPTTDWWMVTLRGDPVWFFDRRNLAERFATDPAYRQRLANKRKAYNRYPPPTVLTASGRVRWARQQTAQCCASTLSGERREVLS